MTSDDGVNWTSQPLPIKDVNFNGVVYGNNKYMAVGDYGYILSSDDGQHWEVAIRLDGGNHLKDIVYADGRFVAVGQHATFITGGIIEYGAIFTSNDGVEWTEQDSTTRNNLTGVSYGDGQYVAVGWRGTILKSGDGTSWSIVESPTPYDLEDVAYGDSGFVAVGYRGVIVHSADGSEWNLRANDLENWMYKYGVGYGNGAYMVVGGRNGVALTSSDGINWTNQASGTNSHLNDVVYGDGIFMAVGEAGAFALAEGLGWSYPPTGSMTSLNTVSYGNGKFVAAGITRNIFGSADGVEWTVLRSLAGTGSYYLGSTYGNGRFVFVGYGGLITTSADGAIWSDPASGTTADLYGVAYGGGIFVAVGTGGEILTSPDGEAWTRQTSGTTGALNGVAYGDGTFVATGPAGEIFTSPDGETWTKHASGTASIMLAVAYGDGTFIAVGGGGTVSTSDDKGETWSAQEGVSDQHFYGIAYGDGTFMTVGLTGNTYFSNDGTHWIHRPGLVSTSAGAALRSLVYVNDEYVAVGDKGNIGIYGLVAHTVNANLGELKLSSGTLIPEFNGGRSVYQAQVGNDVDRIAVTPKAAEADATVEVNGKLVTSGGASEEIPLGFGSNLVTIVVAAADGTAAQTYKLLIERVTHTVNFDSHGGTAVERVTRLNTGDAIVAPVAPTRSGYAFGGWYKEEALVTPWDFSVDTISENLTLHAKWIELFYAVTFDTRGGNAVAAATGISAGAKIAAPAAPTKSGYAFAGWYREATLVTPWNFGADTVTADLILYAKWKSTYTVTFDSQGGSGVAPMAGVEEGTTIAAPAAPTKSTYAFAGWYREGTLVTPWNFDADEVAADITLYAKWEEVVYRVVFNTQGGGGDIELTGVREGATIGEPPAPTRTGYLFAGWHLGEGDGPSPLWNFGIDTVTADLTLYARWTELYRVFFDSQGGSEVEPLTAVIPGSTIAAPPVPTKSGNVFVGWYDAADAWGYWDFDSDTVYVNNLTLYAEWERTEFTVTYDSRGGSVVESATGVPARALIPVPAAPTRDGYAFAGWYSDADYYWPIVFDYFKVYEDMTLYAKWTEVLSTSTYMVTFDSQGGTFVADIAEVSPGSVISAPAVPIRGGSIFDGWYKEAGYDTPWDFEADTVTENIRLYAKWNLAYSVFFDSGFGSFVSAIPRVIPGTKIDEPPIPTWEGYTFAGWYKEDSFATPWDFSVDGVDDNIMLYAKWTLATGGGDDGSSGGDDGSSGGDDGSSGGDDGGSGGDDGSSGSDDGSSGGDDGSSGGDDGSSGAGGSSAASPDGGMATADNGELSLPAGKAGEVSLDGDKVMIEIPADASDEDLKLTIERWSDTQSLVSDKEVLLSEVYEILKNFKENFKKSVKLKFAFDPAKLGSGEQPSVFYYDETGKKWIEVGGVADGNFITAEVDHFTKFAVFAVASSEDEEPIAVEFNDIAGHWAEAAIRQAVSEGIASGYPGGTFQPDRTVTRAEFAVMLARALKWTGEGSALTFTDAARIPSWARNAVQLAVQAGAIHGYDDGTFRSDEQITRAEMAVMIAAALKLEAGAPGATAFADDNAIPSWARGAAAKLKELGLMVGDGENRFHPAAHATRAEAVTVLLGS